MDTPEDLCALWSAQWPDLDPTPYLPRADRWVRFHSLPKSKRYPRNKPEYAILLHRYNAILDELFRGEEIRVVTTTCSTGPVPVPLSKVDLRRNPGAHYWTSVVDDYFGSDLDGTDYLHLYAARRRWQPGSLDYLLRAAADDRIPGALIASLTFDRSVHPYDGGQDVHPATEADRDRLRQRYADWLPSHPQGL
ncbi:hypothetical protein ABZ816_15685 [Actinosynnema sp. NPDC047251]|uniref:DUF3885 domain-containing protein n=1 Tax=Saccharothrix espanaensis (strain ATCC 51144 / DSM 44229 / JCM 9112 / NBRC 15066 / NRRL 15764) TaxID=1179773 RepID=K0JZ53_SACES|nr:hypothetical protein [Saccharothrix espanaensis]CCH29538.1 hypothetical protein BN6_22170 [Saccharothrix espanaensis DSM 44229]